MQDGQGRIDDNLLVEEVTKTCILFPEEIKYPLEFEGIQFNSSQTQVYYCFFCKNRGIFVQQPFTIRMGKQGDPDEKVYVNDRLEFEYNNWNCKDCGFRENIFNSLPCSLKRCSSVRVESELASPPDIRQGDKKILLTIVTRIYNNKYDPGISNLETGLYGSRTINNPIRNEACCKSKISEVVIKLLLCIWEFIKRLICGENCGYKKSRYTIELAQDFKKHKFTKKSKK